MTIRAPMSPSQPSSLPVQQQQSQQLPSPHHKCPSLISLLCDGSDKGLGGVGGLTLSDLFMLDDVAIEQHHHHQSSTPPPKLIVSLGPASLDAQLSAFKSSSPGATPEPTTNDRSTTSITSPITLQTDNTQSQSSPLSLGESSPPESSETEGFVSNDDEDVPSPATPTKPQKIGKLFHWGLRKD